MPANYFIVIFMNGFLDFFPFEQGNFRRFEVAGGHTAIILFFPKLLRLIVLDRCQPLQNQNGFIEDHGIL